MSSINRRRNGLMAFSVIGGSCLEGGSRPLNLKTGRLLLATPETARLATNYRESGFVLRRILVIERCSGEGRLTTPKPDGAEVKVFCTVGWGAAVGAGWFMGPELG